MSHGRAGRRAGRLRDHVLSGPRHCARPHSLDRGKVRAAPAARSSEGFATCAVRVEGRMAHVYGMRSEAGISAADATAHMRRSAYLMTMSKRSGLGTSYVKCHHSWS